MAKKSVSLFMTESDERMLRSAAEELGFSAVRTVLGRGESAVLVPPSDLVLRDDELLFHLVPKGVALGDVPFMAVRDGGARVDPGAPAIEVGRSYVRDGALRHGRIYLHVASGHPLAKVANRAYDALARRIGDWSLTTELGHRVGPEATQLARSGAVRLLSGAVELHVDDR